jgi:PiT family inorganic phosphate transporter
VGLAAFFNFIAFLIFGVAVATTIGKGIINPAVISQQVVLAALIGAIAWDLITWWYGIPTSSSHALVGGLVGATVTKAGTKVLISAGLEKVVLFMFISPIAGAAGGFLLMGLIIRFFGKVSSVKINFAFRKLQLVSASLYSLSHGTNDAQKTMGVVAVLLFSTGHLGKVFYVPLWVVLMAHSAIALGTLAGGWRIVKTMGKKITHLEPVHGFSAETAGAVVILSSTLMGVPVSTTHVISGSILGVGSSLRASAVRWSLARTIVWAWILTIPVVGLISSASYFALNFVASIKVF